MIFGDIYENAEGYRNDFAEIIQLVNQVSEEKAKGEPLIAWFRLRNRRVAQVLDPMKDELNKRKAEEEKREKDLKELSTVLKNVKREIENDNMENAQQLLNNQKIVDVFEDFTTLSNRRNVALNQVSEIETRIKRESTQLENNHGYYDRVINSVERAIETFYSAPHAKDIDIEAYTEAIHRVNRQKHDLDINVPDLKELPDTYDSKTIESLHDEIRAVVARVDSRYPMGLYKDTKKVIRTIIHDVGNDRGKRAFLNRANELENLANEAVTKFNKKYWQITGLRWERISNHQHGYVSVGATHEPINII